MSKHTDGPGNGGKIHALQYRCDITRSPLLYFTSQWHRAFHIAALQPVPGTANAVRSAGGCRVVPAGRVSGRCKPATLVETSPSRAPPLWRSLRSTGGGLELVLLWLARCHTGPLKTLALMTTDSCTNDSCTSDLISVCLDIKGQDHDQVSHESTVNNKIKIEQNKNHIKTNRKIQQRPPVLKIKCAHHLAASSSCRPERDQILLPVKRLMWRLTSEA